jgi:hypothetical protein
MTLRFNLLILLVLGTQFSEAQVKNLPYGVFYLPAHTSATFQPDDPVEWSLWSSPLTDPSTGLINASTGITGVCARQSWEELEPKEGQFNWYYLNTVANKAASHGLYFKICILCCGNANNANRDIFWPGWLTTTYKIPTVTLHEPDCSKTVTNPLPWDSTFEAKVGALAKAIGKRFDANVNLRVVEMTGPGRAEELFFAENCNDYNDLVTAYGSNWPTLWQQACETIAGNYQAAFPTTCIVYSTGVPVPPSDDPDHDNDNDTMAEVITSLNTAYNSGSYIVFGTQDSGYGINTPVPQWGSKLQGYQQALPSATPGTAGEQAIKAYQPPYSGLWFEVYDKNCKDSNSWTDFQTMSSATLKTVGTNNYQ